MPTIRKLRDIITDLGLSTGLKVCLDAGDASSYSGSGDTFSDRSGNGNDFKRGTSAGSDSADPTFNGSGGGLSSGEYFSFDGGDNLTIVGSNPLQTFHKNNATGTILVFCQIDIDGVVTPSLVGDGAGVSALGFRLILTPAGNPRITAGNGSSSVISLNASGLAIPDNAPCCVGMSWDEAVGANGGFFFVNGATELFNSTYTSPSASNAAGVLCISGTEGATSTNRLPAGSKIWGVAIWDVALTQAQVKAIYYEAGMRLGLTVGGNAALSGEGTLAAVGSGAASGAASLSASGSLTAAGDIDDNPDAEEPEQGIPVIGPPLLAGAPLGSLPVASMGPLADSGDAPTKFEQMADLAEVNIIHLVKLSPLTKVA